MDFAQVGDAAARGGDEAEGDRTDQTPGNDGADNRNRRLYPENKSR